MELELLEQGPPVTKIFHVLRILKECPIYVCNQKIYVQIRPLL